MALKGIDTSIVLFDEIRWNPIILSLSQGIEIMAEEWKQDRIEREYIGASAEESTILEYKAAGALGKSPGKKTEITKDVSAMANADGGVIIYGVKVYDEDDKKHLPEKLDPIDRTQFSKEWVEQVINNIRPRINGLTIHPVPVNIDTEPNSVVYVVEIPKSTTAHQATDLRYYRRYNFQCLRMLDHEIRDVMNRATTPDAQVEFSARPISLGPDEHLYGLGVTIKNQGLLVINHFKLEFTFPYLDSIPLEWVAAAKILDIGKPLDKRWLVNFEPPIDNIAVSVRQEGSIFRVIYRSRNVLFPKDEEDISEAIRLRYRINEQIYINRRDISPLVWTLYADNMPPKQGEIPFSKLCNRY